MRKNPRLQRPGATTRLLYDMPHNFVAVEGHGGRMVTVHRKGATRSFGPTAMSLAETMQASTGQPLIMPGSRGRIDIEWALDDRELLVTIPVDAAEQAEFYGYDRDRTIVIKGKLDTDSPLGAWLLTWIAK